MASIERGIAPFFISADWEPFYPTHLYGVFASRWPLNGQTVWTIVNRNEYDVSGRQMSVPAQEGMRYFDLYQGEELKPERNGKSDVLSFPIEAHGFGAILALNGAPDSKMQDLMSRMKKMTSQSLSSYSDQWKTLPQQLLDIASTKPASTTPDGMVKIPAGDYVFKVQGIEIEGFNDIGVDVQYPWEDRPRRFHEHRMQVRAFLMDKYPVTNADFKKFLDASHLPSRRRSELPARLEERHLSAGMGQKAGHLGFTRRRACLCSLGRQASAARVGVAICRAGRRQ
jgi:iron(II)-dependent oxidoreductase